MEERLHHSSTSPIAYPPRDIALRFPSGPAPQTLALSEKSPYPRALLSLASLKQDPRSCPEGLPGMDRSPSGPAPQTWRFRRHRPPPELAGECQPHSAPQKRPGECPAKTVSWDPSCWLRHLLLELRCSLVTGLKYEPQRGPRLALTSSCGRIRHAIAVLPTESFRLRTSVRCSEWRKARASPDLR